jgi:hypothetical protein
LEPAIVVDHINAGRKPNNTNKNECPNVFMNWFKGCIDV